MWFNGTTHPGTFLGQVNLRQLTRPRVLYKSNILSILTDIENSFIGNKWLLITHCIMKYKGMKTMGIVQYSKRGKN